MNKLNLLCLNFEAKLQKGIRLPEYIGNTIRGALGNALVKTHCKKGAPACAGCEHNPGCIYTEVFKAESLLADFSSTPNPYVIKAPWTGRREFPQGEILRFSILLLGGACGWFREIIAAVSTMLRGNFGGNLAPSGQLRVFDADDKLIYDNGTLLGLPCTQEWSDRPALHTPEVSSAELHFITPLKMLQKKELIHAPDFATFTDALFGRIAAIIDLYGEAEFVLPYRLFARKPYIEAMYSLEQVSIKQDKFCIEGMKGSIVFSGNLTDYLPYLALGTQIHVGKLATRGCGEYTLEILG